MVDINWIIAFQYHSILVRWHVGLNRCRSIRYSSWPRMVTYTAPLPTCFDRGIILFSYPSGKTKFILFSRRNHINNFSAFEPFGPIRMSPPSDDNYGTDACDLLCLADAPVPLLCICTTTGLLFHCVIVETGDEVRVVYVIMHWSDC